MSVLRSSGHGSRPGRPSRRFRPGRRTGLLAAASATVLGIGFALPASSLADLAGGCDFAPTGTTASCLGPLAGSTFAGGDGNLLTSPTTFGTTDWQNVAGLHHGVDLPSGTGDNSFGQGTKEDNPNVSVVTGSIPNNKSDLTRFYEASQFSSANSHNFLYLAWERANVLGTANIDFEINHSTQPDLTTTGSKTLNRTGGDLLVTFDFSNGGGRPSIGLLRWLTSSSVPSVSGFATNSCFSANSFPCWGDKLTLDGTDSIGAVNNLDAVTDPLFPTEGNYQNPVPALQFGETAIDLTAAGVFSAGTCEAFGSAMVKSRASTSFTAEAKDFIAPIPVNISNCGAIHVVKQTVPAGSSQQFGYTTTGGLTPSTFTLTGQSTGTPPANTRNYTNLQPGTYTVTEGSTAGWALTDLTCSDSGGAPSLSTATATFTVVPDSNTTCTFTNTQQLGALKVTKTSIKGSTPLSGAKISITDPGGTALTGSPFTTNSSGVVCVDGLVPGNYSVQETQAPSGFTIDDSTAHTVSVTASNAKCTDTTFGGQTWSFTDTPLTTITATATSQATTGGTASTITCVSGTASSTTDVGNSPQGPAAAPSVTAQNLAPGTYTCTIVVDP